MPVVVLREPQVVRVLEKRVRQPLEQRRRLAGCVEHDRHGAAAERLRELVARAALARRAHAREPRVKHRLEVV